MTTMEEEMDLSCPWCGADLGIRNLIEYDDAMADHALTECVPWQKENGYIPQEATEPISVLSDDNTGGGYHA